MPKTGNGFDFHGAHKSRRTTEAEQLKVSDDAEFKRITEAKTAPMGPVGDGISEDARSNLQGFKWFGGIALAALVVWAFGHFLLKIW